MPESPGAVYIYIYTLCLVNKIRRIDKARDVIYIANLAWRLCLFLYLYICILLY